VYIHYSTHVKCPVTVANLCMGIQMPKGAAPPAPSCILDPNG
jgi:hypothetical protein